MSLNGIKGEVHGQETSERMAGARAPSIINIIYKCTCISLEQIKRAKNSFQFLYCTCMCGGLLYLPPPCLSLGGAWELIMPSKVGEHKTKIWVYKGAI